MHGQTSFELPPIFRPETATGTNERMQKSSSSEEDSSHDSQCGGHDSGRQFCASEQHCCQSRAISQLSTNKSSVDHLAVGGGKGEHQHRLSRPESLNPVSVRYSNYFSVQEAEESEESPSLALSPLVRPVMHELVPYKPQKHDEKSNRLNQKLRNRNNRTTT